MRFEHVLQIYWTKGFFFGGKLFYFDQTFEGLFENTPGLGSSFKQLMLDRFELKNHVIIRSSLLTDLETKYHIKMLKPFNFIFSQINSVNNNMHDLKKLNIVRLYLIKSYRGRCHALGKPVNSQRTWSNAWTSYKVNQILRSFINESRGKLHKNVKVQKINYRMAAKKYVTKVKKKPTVVKKKLMWF